MSRHRLLPSPAQQAVLRGFTRAMTAFSGPQNPGGKAPGRVQKINPAFTSQRCSACGQVDGKSRESQAVFGCTACGFACHADVNAARNIAAGHPACLPISLHCRGGDGVARPVNREPQLLLRSA